MIQFILFILVAGSTINTGIILGASQFLRQPDTEMAAIDKKLLTTFLLITLFTSILQLIIGMIFLYLEV